MQTLTCQYIFMQVLMVTSILVSIDAYVLTWYYRGRYDPTKQEIISMAKLRIKQTATEKGIKQSHLQISAAVTPPLLNRYWNNKTSTVDLTELEKIATALGVQPGDLIVSDE